jgi:hypothetical protein
MDEERLLDRAAELMVAAIVAPDRARFTMLSETSTMLVADVVRLRTGITGDLLPRAILEEVYGQVLELVRARILDVATIAAPATAAATDAEEITTAFNHALVETLALKH